MLAFASATTARRSRPFRSARRNAGYNLIDLARGGGILQVLKTTAHQTAMLARPRFTCPGTVAWANRRAARDVTRLYRRMSAAHVTQQSCWACEKSIAERFAFASRSFALSIGRRRPRRRRRHRHRHHHRCRPRHGHGAYPTYPITRWNPRTPSYRLTIPSHVTVNVTCRAVRNVLPFLHVTRYRRCTSV